MADQAGPGVVEPPGAAQHGQQGRRRGDEAVHRQRLEHGEHVGLAALPQGLHHQGAGDRLGGAGDADHLGEVVELAQQRRDLVEPAPHRRPRDREGAEEQLGVDVPDPVRLRPALDQALLERDHVAQLAGGLGPQGERGDQPHGVAELAGQVGGLGGHLQALPGVGAPPGRDRGPDQGVEHEGRVVEAPCHRDRLLRESLALLRRRAVVGLPGQREHHPAAARVVALGQPVERAPQRVDDDLVDLATAGRPERAGAGHRAGPDQQVQVAGLVGHLDRLVGDLAQLQPAARAPEHVGEVGEHLEPVGGGRGRVLVLGAQGVLEHLQRLDVGVDRRRGAGRGLSGRPGPRQVPWSGGQPVPRHLGLAPGAFAERLGGADVHAGPARLRQPAEHRVADQGVVEAEPVHPVLGDQPGRDRGVEPVQGVVLVDARDLRERGQVEDPAQHARRPEQVLRGVLELGQAARQHLVHGGRRPAVGHQRGEVAVLGEPGVLHEEERVALRTPPQRVGVGVGGLGLGDLREDLRGRLGGDPAQLQPERVLAGQRLRHLGQGAGRHRVLAPGRHHEKPGRALLRDRLGEQPEHPQAGGVRPVQVVEHEQQRRPLGGVEHGLHDALPGPERRGLVVVVRGRRQLRAEPLEHGRPRPQRGRAVVLRAAAPGDRDALLRGVRRELDRQAALADAGLAGERDERRGGAGGGDHLVDQSGQGGELVVAPGQRPRPQRRERQWSVRLDARRGRGRDHGDVPGGSGSGGRDLLLAQHRGLHGAQLGPRLEPQLLVEQVAHLPQHGQGVGLPPRPGERERAQRPGPLAQLVDAGQCVQLGGDGRVQAEQDADGRPVLAGQHPQLLEPGPLGGGRRHVTELGERDAAPQPQRPLERVVEGGQAAGVG